MGSKGKRKHPGETSPTAGPSKKRTRGRTPSPDLEERLQRGESVYRSDKDPYFPGDDSQPELPTPNDWDFRLKVTCMDNTPDELLKEAVQGLVKICFPNSFLKELGINVVEAHMREAGASDAAIAKMNNVFESEMIHRLAWMLAEYLDTPRKIEKGISTLASASNRLQGNKIDHRVLDQIISGFTQLRDKIAADQRQHSREAGDPSGAQTLAHDDLPGEVDEASCEDQGPRAAPRIVAAMDRNHKVSKSWRWDVDKASIDAWSIEACFLRRSDLFAYHALPIARREVGATAGRRKVQKRIQELLDDLTKEEIDIWKDCFTKLKNGDLSTLDRVHTGAEHEDNPDDDHRCSRETTVFPPEKRPKRIKRAPVGSDIPNRIRIKTELDGDMDNTRQAPRNQAGDVVDGIVGATAAFRRLSTEQAVTASVAGRQRNRNRYNPKNTHKPSPFGTPVVDLLWGKNPLEREYHKAFVDTVLKHLNELVPTPSITTAVYGGASKTLRKIGLVKTIEAAFTSSKFRASAARLEIEYELQNWVGSNPYSFPELAHESFFFAQMLPNITPIMDAIFPPNSGWPSSNMSQTEAELVRRLQTRSVDMTFQVPPKEKDVTTRINEILHSKTAPHDKRYLLEKDLRVVAFAQRVSFPELKVSSLVRQWESLSKMKW
ncbi:hypothetical protein BDV96DRAFT_605180 [Lophiotrema nucula]|uniref:Uncharacterized protein n=1 Tax=Lophiotrema nucula TaxID=690887 RepID=A0A6A5YRP5_9PLEO|nr:hypothetical protein BDV96DRAFT_605180 [Lophiotrema nucula]